MIGQIPLVRTVAVHGINLDVVVAICAKNDRLAVGRPVRTKVRDRIVGQSPRFASIGVDYVNFALAMASVAVGDTRAVGRPVYVVFLVIRGARDVGLICSVLIHGKDIKESIPVSHKGDFGSFHSCNPFGQSGESAW